MSGGALSFCVALFNYSPASPNETPLKQGCIVTVTQKSGGGWWHGSCDGHYPGMFPCTYVKEFTPSSLNATVLACRANHDPAFFEGNVVRLVHRYDNGYFILFSELYRRCCIAPHTVLQRNQVRPHVQQPSGHVDTPQPPRAHSAKPLPQAPKPLPPAPLQVQKPLPPSPAVEAAKKKQREEKVQAKLRRVDEKRQKRKQEETEKWQQIEQKKEALLEEQKRKAEERSREYMAQSEAIKEEKEAAKRRQKEEEERAARLFEEAQKQAEENRQRDIELHRQRLAELEKMDDQEDLGDDEWDREMAFSDSSDENDSPFLVGSNSTPKSSKAEKNKKKKKGHRSKKHTRPELDSDSDDDEIIVKDHESGNEITIADNLASLQIN